MLSALAAVAAPGLAGAATPASSKYPALQGVLDSYVASKRLPGGVVAIRRGKAPVDYVAAGTLAFDTDARMAPDSLFRVYSMTKPTMGAAAMMLIERGKLKLDQPLGDILPGFKDARVMLDGDPAKTRPAAGPILIRHLLTHTSGLSYAINGNAPLAKLYRQQGLKAGSRGAAALPGELPVAANLVEFGDRLAKLPLDFDPGTRWQYSAAADLMGLVIQTVSGVPLEDFMRKEIFGPLKMDDTFFTVPAAKVDRLTSVVYKSPAGLVVSDDRKSSPFARGNDLPSGGGGLISTAADYARFNAMWLGEGALDGVRLMKPETVRLGRSNLMAPGVTSNITTRPNGFGAFMQVILPGSGLGGETTGTYGWSGAAGTTMWIDPLNDITVVVMVQFMPAGAYLTYLETRVAAYKDLAALGALKA